MTFEQRVSRVSAELLHDSPGQLCPVPLDFPDQVGQILRFLADIKWEVNRIERFVTGRIGDTSEKERESEVGTDKSGPQTGEGRAYEYLHNLLSDQFESWVLNNVPGGAVIMEWIRAFGSEFADFSPIWQRVLIYKQILDTDKKVDDIRRGLFGPFPRIESHFSNLNKDVSNILKDVKEISEGFSDLNSLPELVTQVDQKIENCCQATKTWLEEIYRKIIECCPIDRLDMILDRLDIVSNDVLDIKGGIAALLNGGTAVQSLNTESLCKAILGQVLSIRRLLQ